jgi:hypothetical protein
VVGPVVRFQQDAELIVVGYERRPAARQRNGEQDQAHRLSDGEKRFHGHPS